MGIKTRWLYVHRFEVGLALTTFAAILASVLALYLQMMSQPYAPLSEIRFEFVDSQAQPMEQTPARLSGCSDDSTTTIIFSFWFNGGQTHLGPALATLVEPGCYESEFTMTIPSVEPGFWRLSLVVIAAGEEGTQTLPVVSPPIEVTD